MSGTKPDPVRFGHVASAIREAMKAKGLTPATFNLAAGYPRSHSGIYLWRAAKGAPGPETRAKVAKTLGLAEADLVPKGPVNTAGVAAPKMVVGPLRLQPRPPVTYDARPSDERLAFTVGANGKAHVTLNVELPLARAAALVAVLVHELEAADAPTQSAA